MTETMRGTSRRLHVFGLYTVIAYALVLAVPRDLSLPSFIPLGRFTLEGQAAAVGYLLWLGIWLVAIGGLAWRRHWGYRLGLTVFSLHVLLVVSNTLRWLADNDPSLNMALGLAVLPALQLVLADALAVIYLREHRGIFEKGRGLPAAWSSAQRKYQDLFGLRESPGD